MARKVKRIPALPPDKLNEAGSLLDKLPVDAASKKLLREMLAVAADPRSETPQKVIATLPAPMARNAKDTVSALATLRAGQLARARAALDALDGDEWERLLDEAYPDGENQT